jgi:hypothetical protein
VTEDQIKVLAVAILGAVLLAVVLALLTPLPEPPSGASASAEEVPPWEIAALQEEARRITREATE